MYFACHSRNMVFSHVHHTHLQHQCFSFGRECNFSVGVIIANCMLHLSFLIGFWLDVSVLVVCLCTWLFLNGVDVQALDMVLDLDMPAFSLHVVQRAYLSFSVTEKGELCVFPFKYKGKSYEKCIMEEKKRPWCATTADYQGDGKWGYCVNGKNFLYLIHKALN